MGDLQFNRKVWFRGTELRAEEVAAQLAVGARKQVTVGEHTQGYFTKKIWLPEYPQAGGMKIAKTKEPRIALDVLIFVPA